MIMKILIPRSSFTTRKIHPITSVLYGFKPFVWMNLSSGEWCLDEFFKWWMMFGWICRVVNDERFSAWYGVVLSTCKMSVLKHHLIRTLLSMMSLFGVGSETTNSQPECTTRDGWWTDMNNTLVVLRSSSSLKLTNVVNSNQVDVFHTYSLANNSLALNYIY